MKKSIFAAAFLALSFSLMAQKLPKALTDSDFHANGNHDPKKVELGKLLFFDKILSGNQNISCATCHHPQAGTGDGLSLPVGEGGKGLGVTRNTGEGADEIHERVPRNAPHVFNLGAKQLTVFFHDGRLAVDASQPSGFLNPAGDDLPTGLDNILAAQAMFPVTSGAEMAGQAGENPQADFAAAGNLPALWNFIATKLQGVPEYVTLFKDVYADVNSASDITYVHAANAIAAFEASAWRFDNSPFDRHLKGDKQALSASQKIGMNLFYGKAKCSDCHSGALQTDMDFHSIAMPTIGTGKGDGFNGQDDFGREKVTGDTNDRYKFRTPVLRNVQLTAPYGHAGAFDTLEAVVRHHLNPSVSYDNYDRTQVTMPNRADLDAIDFTILDDPISSQEIKDSSDINKITLSEKEIAHLLDFLRALTDPAALDMRKDVPKKVPSGLPIFD